MGKFNLRKFIVDVFNPLKGEKVFVVYDVPHGDIKDNKNWSDRRLMASEWWRGFDGLSKEMGFIVHPLMSHDASGKHNGDLPKTVTEVDTGKVHDLETVVSDTDIVVTLDEYSASAPFLAFAKKYPRLRVASMPFVLKEMEESALSADYKEVAKTCKKISDQLQESVGAEVFFDTGHKCYFDLRGANITMDNGYLHADKKDFRLINLPSGETFCAPKETFHGGESLTKGELPFKKHGNDDIVVYQVENNMIREIIGDNKLGDEQRAYFAVDPARCNIAEFGLGCNDKAIIRNNLLEDEKAGFHWAIGRSDHYGGTVGVSSFKSPENVAHYDNIYAKNSPIAATSIVLYKKDGTKFEIWDGNWYTV